MTPLWNPHAYLTEVGWHPLPEFQRYQMLESTFATSMPNLSNRTVLEAGAGYGRVLPTVARGAKQVLAVELDDGMYAMLEKHAGAYPNVTPINGDYTQLDELVAGMDLARPVILSLQNTLGTTMGSWLEGARAMRHVAEKGRGDVVASVLNAEAFACFGIELYGRLIEFTGAIDEAKTDFHSGRFVSVDGYVSQWFTPEMRQQLLKTLGGTLETEVRAALFTILHVCYS
jgi:SAM-dependent methyltransferase